MNGVPLFVLCILVQVELLQSNEEVSAYVGDTVTLRSGADSTWNVSRIEWFIFRNNTWIATFQNGRKNTRRLARYGGRLELDVVTGDLTIRDLVKEDGMEYRVDLQHGDNTDTTKKFNITVKQRLRRPTIKRKLSPTADGCWVLLSCSSPDEVVHLSWQVKPQIRHAWSASTNGTSQLFAQMQHQQEAVFSCTSSRQTETVAEEFAEKCEVEVAPSRKRCWFACFFGGLVGGMSTVLFYLCCAEKIKKCCRSLKERLWQGKD
ncbi:CD48 antigen [Menidia menidia]